MKTAHKAFLVCLFFAVITVFGLVLLPKNMAVYAVAPPTITTFTVNGSTTPAPIARNTNVTVTWAATNATSCIGYSSIATTNWNVVTLATSGSRSNVGTITTDRTLSIVCLGPGGRTSANVRVSVIPLPEVVIWLNEANGVVWVANNATATISWAATNATSCSVSPAQAFSTWSVGTKATSGTVGGVGPFTGSVITVRSLGITCVGPSGSDSDSLNVYNSSATTVPFVNLKANASNGPVTINSGDSVTLSWTSSNITNAATGCTASADVATTGWNGTKASTGSGVVIGPITSTRRLIISCARTGVGSSADQVYINVNPVIPSVPGVDLQVNSSNGPVSIQSGSPGTATWSTTNASACTAYATATITNWSGAKATNNAGGQSIIPTVQQSYASLQCSGTGGVQTDNVELNLFYICGNGALEPGETCDDGNIDNADYCNNTCTINQIGGGSCGYYQAGNFQNILGICTGTGTLFTSMGVNLLGSYFNTPANLNAFNARDISDANFLFLNSYSGTNAFDNSAILDNVHSYALQVARMLNQGKHIMLVTDGSENNSYTFTGYDAGGMYQILAQLGLMVVGDSGIGEVLLSPTAGTLLEYQNVRRMYLSSASRIIPRPGGATGNLFSFPPYPYTYTCQYSIASDQTPIGGLNPHPQAGWCVWGQVRFGNGATLDIVTSGAAFTPCVGGGVNTRGQIAHGFAEFACIPPSGTIRSRAAVVPAAQATCANINASTTYLNGSSLGFSVPNGISRQTQAGGAYVTWNNLATGNYTADAVSPAPPPNYVFQRGCWSSTDGTSGQDANSILTAGATVTYNLGMSLQPDWMQVVGGSLNAGGGSIDISVPINQTLLKKEPAVTQNSPVVSFGTTLTTGAGTVSEEGYNVTDNQQIPPANFSYYDYYSEQFGAKTTLSSGAADPIPSGGTVGVYVAGNTGNMTVSGTWDVANGQYVVIFVPGNLTISTNITVNEGGFLAFIVKGTVTVSENVGYSVPLVNPDKVTQANVTGIYVSDGQFITQGTTAAPDRQLIVAGTVVADGFTFNRDLEANNSSPGEMFIYRPDLWAVAPNELKEVDVTWTEVAP